MRGPFQIDSRDPGSLARAGVLRTPHGEVRTPAFVPLATKATVKGLDAGEVAALGYDMVLGNTFHLFLEPGHELIARFGGLHEFMGWDGPIITDSGGFQVFSMGHGTWPTRSRAGAPPARAPGLGLKIEEDGVRFRSYLDGSERFMAPETSMEIQAALGSDIALVFDECTPFHVDARVHRALDRAHASLAAALPGLARRSTGPEGQLVYGIVQGGVFEDLRDGVGDEVAASRVRRHRDRRLAGRRQAADARGRRTGRRRARRRVEAQPRHLLGIGDDRRPDPRRRAGHRHVRLRDADAAGAPRDGARARPRGPLARRPQRRPASGRRDEPIMDGCPCPACATGLTRGYLRYLAKPAS